VRLLREVKKNETHVWAIEMRAPQRSGDFQAQFAMYNLNGDECHRDENGGELQVRIRVIQKST
jgi:hypothetical protein